LRILFTSIGRRVELIQAYKSASDKLGVRLTIYGSDVSGDAPALFFCDRQVEVCRINKAEYIPQLIEICNHERIDALIPTIDTDLLMLAKNRERFGNTRVIISDEDKVRICRDKRLTANFFSECSLKTPITVDDVKRYAGGFPCFIKPIDGSSSINAFKVDNAEDLAVRASEINSYIIQPFIEGKEYTIDAFCDFDGNPMLITPRERVAIRSGEVMKTRIHQDQRMIDECKAITGRFKPRGAITIQLIREGNTGEDYFIEINPRFGGGAPLSIKAGADAAEMTLRLLKGENPSYQDRAAKDAATYSRFDQSVCTVGGSATASAIVFDLDDTLYSEKEYVLSGFKAVEQAYPQIKSDNLWAAFESGKPAFDKYENKQQLIAVYREHTPDIYLYDGVKEMLVELRKRGIKLGIITDGRPNGQRNKILALGLDKLVDEIIVTDELGMEFRKPNEIPFRIMQQKLRTPFEQMVYIGDNVNKDFIAPCELNMQVLYFNNADGLYYDNERNAFIKVDAEYNTISEITRHITGDMCL
jgi:HAD superfamily hydrolase (TIGR01549 family)